MKQITHVISKVSWLLGLLLLLNVILVPPPLQANGFGEREVRAAVETWVRYVTADARPDAVVERMEPYRVNGETVAYIAHLQGGGFCLAGADELVLPVYFYSPQGTYDSQNPNYQYILWEISARLETLRNELVQKPEPALLEYSDALSERSRLWQDLIAGRSQVKAQGIVAQAEPVMMELGLTSQWNQISPYNNQCPILNPAANEHTVTGCNATAIAQIMYYWKWPNTGVSSHSVNYEWWQRNNWDEEPLATDPGIPANWEGGGRLEWSAANGGKLRMNGYWDNSLLAAAQNITDTLTYQNALQALWNRLTPYSTPYSANFGATTYNWNILQDTYTAPPYVGDAELAKLLLHAGIAIDTYYGVKWSGSDLWRTEAPLETYFRYDQDATYGGPDNRVMIEEIQWLRPVGFSGSAPNLGGHTWVIFGYNKGTDPDQFKMNMGWGGNLDGWYTFDNVPRGLNDNHRHLTYIAPLNVVKFIGNDTSGDGSPDNPYRDIEEAITAAPNGASLIFKAGSDNTFSASTLTINRPFTLKGKGITIRKE